MYNEGYFDAVHFFRYFLLNGGARLKLRVGNQEIIADGDFPSFESTWVEIGDKGFDPVRFMNSGNEDDILDAVVEVFDLDHEWDWGAEHSEDDR